MKIVKIVLAFLFAGSIVGGIIYGQDSILRVLKGHTYNQLLTPIIGAYYSVEATRTVDGHTFVIGKKVLPQIGGTVREEGDLLQIEVPEKMADHPAGHYLVVTKDRFNQNRTWYFANPEAVVKHALEH